MPDQPANPANPPAASQPKPVKDGFSAPIDEPGDGKVPDYINEWTLMAKGYDPETGQLVSVNLAVLKKKYGDEKGQSLYNRIARVGGFFNPTAEPQNSHYAPDLQLEGLAPDIRKTIDSLLAS